MSPLFELVLNPLILIVPMFRCYIKLHPFRVVLGRPLMALLHLADLSEEPFAAKLVPVLKYRLLNNLRPVSPVFTIMSLPSAKLSLSLRLPFLLILTARLTSVFDRVVVLPNLLRAQVCAMLGPFRLKELLMGALLPSAARQALGLFDWPAKKQSSGATPRRPVTWLQVLIPMIEARVLRDMGAVTMFPLLALLPLTLHLQQITGTAQSMVPLFLLVRDLQSMSVSIACLSWQLQYFLVVKLIEVPTVIRGGLARILMVMFNLVLTAQFRDAFAFPLLLHDALFNIRQLHVRLRLLIQGVLRSMVSMCGPAQIPQWLPHATPMSLPLILGSVSETNALQAAL